MELTVAEKIERFGVEQVSDLELLSTLVRPEKAVKLLKPDTTSLFNTQSQGLRCLSKDFYTLRYEVGLSKTEAARIVSVFSIIHRISIASAIDSEHITSPGDGAQLLLPLLRHETHEKFVVLLLNTKNRIIKTEQIAEGSLTSAVVHPREVFAPAVVAHAACILVAHNHPSGDPYPSTEDRKLTKALEEAGIVLGIPLLDHLVIGDGRYYSFKEHGDL